MCAAGMAAAVRPCDDGKSDDVTSVGSGTSVSAADLHLFSLVGCNNGISASALLLHISNRP